MTRDDLSLSKFFQIFNEMFIIRVKSNIFYYYIPESREYCFKDRFFVIKNATSTCINTDFYGIYGIYTFSFYHFRFETSF